MAFCRPTLLLLFAGVLAGAAAAPPHLPELGTKRRVVMANMRASGLVLLESAGDTLTFTGALKGFGPLETASFHFRGLSLDRVHLMWVPAATQQGAERRFRRLRKQLAAEHGNPWYDSLSQRRATADHAIKANWNLSRSTIDLHTDPSRRVLLTLSAKGESNRSLDARAEQSGQENWAPAHFRNRVTQAKQTTEELLQEFGQQPFVKWGVQKTGRPLGVLLKVNAPAEIADVNDLIRLRFLYFAKGNWDVNMVTQKRKADLLLNMRVLPVSEYGRSRLMIRLEARAAHGKAQGRVLYSASRTLE